jgi:hypothetical protein
MTYSVWDHQGKAQKYIETLSSAYERVSATNPKNQRGVTFVIADNDVRGRRTWLTRFLRAGCPLFFIYPHSARPNLVNDIRSTWAYTTATFVSAVGHQRIMRLYGYQKPIHVVGWHLCPLESFQPRPEMKNILFAPIHPRNAKIDRQVNRAAFERLHRVSKEQENVKLTVRHIGNLDENGLEAVPGVSYVEGRLEPSWEMIDTADLVVGHQTYAYLAVARGVPTLMMAEDMPTHLVPKTADGAVVLSAKNWKKYAKILAYPLDILRTDDPWGMIQRATRTDEDIQAWRKNMIGPSFDPKALLAVIDFYVGRRQFYQNCFFQNGKLLDQPNSH